MQNPLMTGAELSALGAELGLDVIGAARAEPYTDTEEHIRDRRCLSIQLQVSRLDLREIENLVD